MISEKLDTEIFNVEENERQKFLQSKRHTPMFEVAFCGHFSAGKSTILNSLLGAEVLPTSPIPTSANIIEIKNGEQGLTVFSKDEDPQKWVGEIPWNKVREWGMNGHSISKMTITAPLPFLGEHSCILDTPGVDSTDESHEAITVEQLYTTDAIVYVMDYNHVQSETNLYFLKQLSIEKKPIYIVINQIDKHNEEEIPISIFKQSVETVFANWNIHYLGLYFTSMKNKEHHLNQFSQFEKQIKALLFHSNQLIDDSLLRLEHGLYKTVEKRLLEEQQEKLLDVATEMKEKGYDIEDLNEKKRLSAELDQLLRYEEGIWKSYDEEVGKLLKNVILFPAITTDLARNWIESLQPGFKVGILFTKKKTEEEQEKRLNQLVENLNDKVKSQLLFHLQAYFNKVERVKLSSPEKFDERFSKLDYQVSKELLKAHVRTDHAGREYVFAFTSEVTATIVRDIQRNAKELVELMIKEMKQFNNDECQKVRQKLEKLREVEMYQQTIEKIEAVCREQVEIVRNKLKDFPSLSKLDEKILKAMEGSFPDNHDNSFSNISFHEDSVINLDHLILENKPNLNLFSEEDAMKWLNQIKAQLNENRKTILLANERNHLIDRINRLEKQTFVISLFGAFSAGKSSFANALLGDHVLPVSPNPTTATISTVEQSNSENEHGTARVTVKTEESLNNEIKSVSEQLDFPLTLTSISSWNPDLNAFVSSWQKTSAEYLLTLKESLATTQWKLGSEWVVPHGELDELVANEKKSSLIEKVHIYFDSPITKKGIILVDTPGVNSIHGRHTNVAFKQMRSSDAIFYLTYYNHAFSKADQYFLQQMAKVNESFQHDKLYFVINAADLASSVGELNGVRKHVFDQLQKNGIEEPRLYHLSSKEGLQLKKQGIEKESSFYLFEQAFYEYTIMELKQLSVSIIKNELLQFKEKIADSLQFMKEEESTQKLKHEALKEVVAKETSRINELSFTYVFRDVKNEYEQLSLYLRERMRYVLSDFYSSAINVAVLTGNSKRELQEQLSMAIREWRGLGEVFLRQELEATSIRLEETMKKRVKKWLNDELQVMKKSLPFVFIEDDLQLMPIKVQHHDLHLDIEVRNYLSTITSKKNFFEEGKVKQLKELLVEDGVEKSGIVINTISQLYISAFEETLTVLSTEIKVRMKKAVQDELNRFEALLDPEEHASLEKEFEQLSRFII